MSNKVTFETRKPIPLDSQIKSFGKHENIPMSNADAFRVLAAGVTPVLTTESGEEIELTFENLDENISPNEDEEDSDDGEDDKPTPPEEPEPEPGKALISFEGDNVYLNGTPATIKEEGGVTYIFAKDSKGVECKYEVKASTTVIGGAKGASVPSSKIVMESGTVKNIYGGGWGSTTVNADVDDVDILVKGGKVTYCLAGGGRLKSVCNTVTIKVEDGIVASIQGGGFASAGADGSVGTKENPQDSPCIVRNVDINIDKVTMPDADSCLFGGGQGYSYVGEVNMVINNADIPKGYLVAGGSNGRTDNATVVVNGGNYNIVQSINRGSMLSSNTVLNGGKFAKVYAGGEDPESLAGDIVNGFIGGEGAITLDIAGGTVKELLAGSNGGDAITADDSVVIVTVDEAAVVENIEDAKVAFGSSLIVA